MSTQAATKADIELDALQRKFAVRQAKRYLKFSSEHFGNGFRYSMEEFLRLQGVREDLIPKATRVVKSALGV